MLHEFLTANRDELVERCQQKVGLRSAPRVGETLKHGIPIFLDQLIKTLRMEQSDDRSGSRKISGPAGGILPQRSELGEAATLHGRELLQSGYTVDQVVHDYGDLCQAITELAFEVDAPIEVDEFRTLNRCLDNGIAESVTEFVYRRDNVLAGDQVSSLNERLGFFAHELRNLVTTATLSVAVIKAGTAGHGGATGAVLDRSLVRLRHLIDRSLSEVRMTAGLPTQHELFSLAHFIEETKLSGTLEAQVRKCVLTVSTVDSELAVDADRDLLASAVGNLLQNAFKFTRAHTEVTLSAFASGNRILIEVEDHCGGLGAGVAETMFQPFTQSGEDTSGLGLGLTISRQSVEANGGTLSVRDLPGQGCVFRIDLPRHAMPHPPMPLSPLSPLALA